MHTSSVHKHGAQIADTSLHLDVVAFVGNGGGGGAADATNDDVANDLIGNDCTACIKLATDEPKLDTMELYCT